MDKFCSKCGSPLGEDGLCPNCAVEAPKEEAAAVEVVYEPEKEPEYKTAGVEQETAQPAEEPKPRVQLQNIPQPAAEVPPSKFALTAKQVWNIIKNFFSKNTVDAIAAQYDEKLPVWGILLPVYALISAISAAVTFKNSGEYSSELRSIMQNVSFGSGEIFFIDLIMSAVLVVSTAIAVRAFIKIHKGDGHFLSSANLISASQLPLVLIGLFNIITGGSVSGFSSSLTAIATCASYMLLFAGISKALGGKKPIWSFFLMLACAAAAAVIVTLIIASPILFSRVVYSIMDTFSY